MVASSQAVVGTAGCEATAVPRRWGIYIIETGSLGVFLIAAAAFTALVEHPQSPIRQVVSDALVRRAVTGIAMGLTFAAIAYSPWGQRSGAHLNPSVTLSFLRLGKIAPRDGAFYIGAQFAGGIAAVLLMSAVANRIVADPSVNYVATSPGEAGPAAAFVAEAVISFGMMSLVLFVSNTPQLARYTAASAACLVAIYITVEAPFSGMSMNPARSFGPALAAGSVNSLWIYFTAPSLGMLLAAELYVRRFGAAAVRCAKLHHPATGPCHFRCRMGS